MADTIIKEKEVKKRAPTTRTRAKKKEVVTELATIVAMPSGEYVYSVGRRKTSIARVRVYKTGTGLIKINGKELEKYFPVFELHNMMHNALKMVGLEGAVDVVATVEGGGMRGQAEAVRLGVSRSLTKMNEAFRKTLKKLGYLTRDPRAKERKKPGLKRARRAPQWSKR